jgi:hypothetical protein
MTPYPRSCLSLAMMLTVLLATSACATSNATPDAVVAAYGTSGLIAVQPYHNSIFHTHDF